MMFSAFQGSRYLFLLTFAVLIVFGVGSLLRIVNSPDRAALYIFYALAMFGDAFAMLFCGVQLNRRTKIFFFLSIFVLALNIIPTIFDQFGLVDLLFVSLNLMTLIFLIAARKEFLPA